MKQSSKCALGGIVSALSLVLMISVAVIPFLTYALPAAAGMLIVFMVIETDKKWAFGVYAAVAILGVLLVPGCEGSAEESVAKFLVGEKQGDPTILEIGREEDPDDPMACMHDCAKCSGCGPSELLKQIPVEEIK